MSFPAEAECDKGYREIHIKIGCCREEAHTGELTLLRNLLESQPAKAFLIFIASSLFLKQRKYECDKCLCLPHMTVMIIL
jgi:hypothetical protein